jgi:inner membrane transporter RhtA
VVTQHVGDRFSGIDGLAVSIPVAALVSTPFGLAQAWGHVGPGVLLLAVVCALLAPILPWTFELYALRRLSKAAFGTLMALEPAIAVTIGAALLHQIPDALRMLGTVLVVVAGVAAERIGHRALPAGRGSGLPPESAGADLRRVHEYKEVLLYAARDDGRAHP